MTIGRFLSRGSPPGLVDLVEPAQTGARDAAALRNMLPAIYRINHTGMLSSDSEYSSNVLVKTSQELWGGNQVQGTDWEKGSKNEDRGIRQSLSLQKAVWQDTTWTTRKIRKMTRTWITALKQWECPGDRLRKGEKKKTGGLAKPDPRKSRVARYDMGNKGNEEDDKDMDITALKRLEWILMRLKRRMLERSKTILLWWEDVTAQSLGLTIAWTIPRMLKDWLKSLGYPFPKARWRNYTVNKTQP
jgi:hypothetical protein